jgi:hypothetical protein
VVEAALVVGVGELHLDCRSGAGLIVIGAEALPYDFVSRTTPTGISR